MWALVIIVIQFANTQIAITSLPGFNSRISCEHAREIVRSTDTLTIKTFCVNVK